MASRGTRGNRKSGGKKDRRPVRDIVLTQLMPHFVVSSDAWHEIDPSGWPDNVTAAFVSTDDDVNSEVLDAANQLCINLRSKGIATVVPSQLMERLSYFDGVQLMDADFVMPEVNEDAEAIAPSTSHNIDRLMVKLADDEYFGFGPAASLDDALNAAELQAAYVIFDVEADQDGMTHIAWWAKMIEVPVVAMTSNKADLEEIAGLGPDFIMRTFTDADVPRINQILAEDAQTCRTIFAERSSAV